MKKSSMKIIPIVVIVLLINQISFSQEDNSVKLYNPVNLSLKYYKIAKKKGLADIEMIWLIQKGYKIDVISKTPVNDLRKNLDLKLLNLESISQYSPVEDQLNSISVEQKLNESRERIRILESYIKELQEKVKILEQNRQ
jgi:hypothetical protein